MKKTIFIGLAIVSSSLSFAQKQFFKPEKLIETGVYYYPEAWNPDQWDRDFKKMAEMGFEFTHMAEFAWAQLEPTEGNYDFKWIDKAVELAGKYNLKVIMCTPVATPPVWLTKKYPEVLVQLPNGQLAQHGTREHYSWSSPKYQELTKKWWKPWQSILLQIKTSGVGKLTMSHLTTVHWIIIRLLRLASATG